MTVGDLRAAIRRMMRVAHPRTRARRWAVVGIAAALALIVQVVQQGDWAVFGLGAGIAFGVVGVFLLVGRLWGWIALAAGLGLGLGTLPLFGVLGLELSLATALFASIMAADLGSGLARTLARIPPAGVERAAYPGAMLVRGALASSALAVGITLIVGVIAALRGIVVPTCDWWFGTGSFLAMPVASAALFGAAGHAMGALVGPRRVVGAVVAQLPAIVVAIAAVWRFHAAPPVYTYNAVLGYFPGNMYDEQVRLTSALAWSRLEQLAWLACLLALVAWRFDVASYRVKLRAPRPASRRLGALGVALVAGAAAVALRWHGGTLGFAVDAEDLEAALGGRHETEHFVIYYSRSPEIEADIELIAADHEYRYDQVTRTLGIAPAEKLVSFYFADRDEKYRLHGSRDVEMAKPWRGEIYMDHRAFPVPSLRHEIAHAVAAEFGDPLWGVASQRVLGVPALVSPGLVEGLAVAVDWPSDFDRPNPHQLVRVIQALGNEPSLESLLGLSFFTVSSSAGYTMAGSFLRFLLDSYGAPKLRELYASGGDFEAAYGMPRARLEREWKGMLETIQLPAGTVEAQRERFRRGSVFQRPCPHAIAKARDQAAEAFVDGDRPRAIALMRDVCRDSGGDPRYLTELGNFLYAGEDRDRAEALHLWTRVAVDEEQTTTRRADAFERLARAAAARGELDHARAVIAFARRLSLSLDERRQLDAMAFALAHEGPAGEHLRAYFFPTRPPVGDAAVAITGLASAQAAAAAEPSLGFAHYLVGLQHHARREHAEAAAALARALELDLPGLGFKKNAARRLAISAYRTRDAARLERATTALSGPDMTSGDHLLAQDWRDRVAFDARRRATSR